MSHSFSHGALAAIFLTMAVAGTGAVAVQDPGRRAKSGPESESESASDSEKATAAAATWLAIVDDGRYEESWKEASETFRANMSRFGKGEGFWEKALETSRKPLGALVRRSVIRAQPTAPMPGVPAGEATKYIEVVYRSEFDREREATETLTIALDADGAWRVYNYVIRRPS